MSKLAMVRLLNKGKQSLSLQVHPPEANDFFLHEQQIHLAPRQSVQLPKDHLRWEQVTNLVGRGLLQIVSDGNPLGD